MNKGDLILFVKEQTALNKTQSEKAVNAVFEGIVSALKKREDVSFVLAVERFGVELASGT